MSIARLMQMGAAGNVGGGFNIANASYDSVSFNVNSQETTAYGLAFNNDGTKMYVVGITGDTVFQYSLSSAFDLSTASYDSVSFSVASQHATPTSVSFNNDGTKMYIIGYFGSTAYQYSLSSAFNISTASYDSVSFNVSAQEGSPFDMVFNNDGTKMYVVGVSSDTVYQYSLSPAFDLSTASYDSVSFSVSSQESNPAGLAFNSDGTKMYIIGYNSDAVHQYSLSSAFDLSTASYDSVSFSVASQDGAPRKLSFNTDGTKMFILGDATNAVYQYSTA